MDLAGCDLSPLRAGAPVTAGPETEANSDSPRPERIVGWVVTAAVRSTRDVIPGQTSDVPVLYVEFETTNNPLARELERLVRERATERPAPLAPHPPLPLGACLGGSVVERVGEVCTKTIARWVFLAPHPADPLQVILGEVPPRTCPRCGVQLLDFRNTAFSARALAREGTCYRWSERDYTCGARSGPIKNS